MDLLPLTTMLEKLLGSDEDDWPPEAQFIVAAHHGNVRRLKAQQGCAFLSSDTFRCGIIQFFLVLCEAIDSGNGLTEAIKWWLEAGANPNTPDSYGRMPIELAAVYGTREDVEILFPFTSPIPTVAIWSVHGLINHVKLESKQLEDDDFVQTRKSELKQQGDDAFEKQDYVNASVWYTQALKVDPSDGYIARKQESSLASLR